MLSLKPRRLATQLVKLAESLMCQLDRKAIIHGVATSREHRRYLQSVPKLNSVMDIGANNGQFILEVLKWHAPEKILAFEPMPESCDILRRVFNNVPPITVYQYALGEHNASENLHVLPDSPSSSLLTPTQLQLNRTPGWSSSSPTRPKPVSVRRLDELICERDLPQPCLCKIDVQGYEERVLRGFGNLIEHVDYLVVELSFTNYYHGNALASRCIDILHTKNFALTGVHDMHIVRGACLQGDFTFSRNTPRQH